MITTNKGFNYIFSTSKEDHMVSKILSGHDTSTNVAIQDLHSFDSQTRSTISSFQRHLFSTCHNLRAAQHNVNQAVLDVLTSTVIRHYPLLKHLNADTPFVPLKLDARSLNYLHVHRISQIQSYPIIDHQAAVINHFIEHVKLQDARMDALEAKMNDPRQGTSKRQKSETSQCDASQAKKQRRSGNTTVNRIESNWNQLTLLLGKKPRLDSGIWWLSSHQTTIIGQLPMTTRRHTTRSRQPDSVPDYLSIAVIHSSDDMFAKVRCQWDLLLQKTASSDALLSRKVMNQVRVSRLPTQYLPMGTPQWFYCMVFLSDTTCINAVMWEVTTRGYTYHCEDFKWSCAFLLQLQPPVSTLHVFAERFDKFPAPSIPTLEYDGMSKLDDERTSGVTSLNTDKTLTIHSHTMD
ncbi:LOW QUALITY PROTEIN: Hypothetical protein PHPALM_12492 [Phytophthora palmivora]|uniref:Uncharacterized protein n=1 Tax=Phytophthora palmivora TaxID=4796 RepID=A0A2P4XZL2_9STRA|nr:LOW QUALITY PROTEIN: Hypothetical protein PHPALM_12492 [Phytophthora palmivora]